MTRMYSLDNHHVARGDCAPVRAQRVSILNKPITEVERAWERQAAVARAVEVVLEDIRSTHMIGYAERFLIQVIQNR